MAHFQKRDDDILAMVIEHQDLPSTVIVEGEESVVFLVVVEIEYGGDAGPLGLLEVH